MKMLIPLIQRLYRHNSLDICVFALTQAQELMEQVQIPYFGYRHLTHLSDPRAIALGESLVTEMIARGDRVINRDESVAYLGLNYYELERVEGELGARKKYDSIGRQAFSPVRLMRKLLAEISPDLVVTTNSPRTEEAVVVASGQLGLKSLVLAGPFLKDELTRFSSNRYGSIICAMYDWQKRELINKGRLDNTVVVTGNPAFCPPSDEELAKNTKALRLKADAVRGSSVVLWVSNKEPASHPYKQGISGDPDLPRRVEQVLLDIARKNPDLTFLLRPHPSENIDYRHEMLPDNVFVNKEELWASVYSADAVILQSSSVGVIAALLGKPILHLQESILSDQVDYSWYHARHEVSAMSDLPRALEDVLAISADSSRQTRRDHLLHDAQPSPMEQISALIRSMTGA